MIRSCIFGLFFVATLTVSPLCAAESPISLYDFSDGISHWQKKFSRDHVIDRYSKSDYTAIANNFLNWQNEDGGWPKNIDWLATSSPAELYALMGVEGPNRSSFDNRNTYPQIAYLAEAYTRSGNEAFREGAVRGLAYLFREQRPTGGWRGDDVDAITFNDDTMVGIMSLLRDIRDGDARYAWLDEETHTKAADALERALACTLNCQIVVQGVKTAWCQQHDHKTLLPIKARAYELPAITANESVGVVLFLMGMKNPSPAVTEAVEDAVAWFRSAAIPGIRLDHPNITPTRFENHTAEQDVVVVNDASAPPMWARYYDLETGQPFFCRRDGTRVGALAEVDLERRTGYAWYGDWPSELLATHYPRWKKRVSTPH